MEQSKFDNRVWGGFVLRGVVAILFGMLALARPNITAGGLVLLFGVYAFVDGIFSLVAAGKVAGVQGRWWPLLLVGLLGIGVGVLAFARPAAMAVGIVYYIAFWAVFTGILEVGAAVRLRKVIQGEWMLAVAGLLSVAFGIMIAARPGAGLLSLIWLIGAYAIIFGALEIGLGFRLRGVQHRLAPASHA